MGGKPGKRVGVDVQDVPDPVHHANLVIQLHHEDLPAAGDLARRQDAKDRPVPALHACQEIGVKVTDDILDFVLLVDKRYLGILAEDPLRDALVDRFGHDVRTGTGNDPQAHLRSQVQEAGQVAHRVSVTVEIESAFFHLVPAPGDVRCQGVESCRFQQAQAVAPLVGRRAVIMEFAGLHQDRLVVDPELTISCNEFTH